MSNYVYVAAQDDNQIKVLSSADRVRRSGCKLKMDTPLESPTIGRCRPVVP